MNWRTITHSQSPSFMVKGTELARAVLPNCRSRFCVYEVRCLDADRQPDVFFRLRDAETVSDEDVRSGARPRVVFESREWSAILSFVEDCRV